MRRWVAPLVVSFLVFTACAPAARPAAPAAPASGAPAASAPAAAPAAQPAAQAAPAAPAAKDKVSVRLGWVMKGEYGFLIVGKEAGIFDKYGLDVDIGEGKGSTAAMQAVAQKQDTFGYTGGSGYLIARSKDMPIKMTAVMLQKGPQVLLSYPDSPVRSPKDLEGKSMVLSPGEAFSSLWP